MGRPLPRTKLSITRWAEIMGINPAHFWGLTLPENLYRGCSNAWPQYSYQSSDRASRDEVAMAIQEAEARIEQYVGWHLMPSYDVDERARIPKPYRPDLIYFNGGDLRGYRPTLFSRWGKFIAGGRRALTLVDADAAVTYTDTNADPGDETTIVYKQTASWTVTTDVDVCELRAFYPGKAGEPAWEIRPLLAVVDNGNGTVTMTCRREQLVLEETYQDFEPEYPDATNDAAFLEQVAVYRVYTDPTQSMTAQWEPGGCNCSGATCSCSLQTSTACLLPRDPAIGLISYSPAVYDADDGWTYVTWTDSRRPDAALLSYQSGYSSPSVECPQRDMDPRLEMAVAYFAAALLSRDVCSCAQDRVSRWAQDYAFDKSGRIQAQALFNADTNNPFGTRVGAIEAWRMFSRAQGDLAPIARP